jgi:hypothetical protein
LGSYPLLAGKNSLIKISNKQADGTVVADAVLVVPEFK